MIIAKSFYPIKDGVSFVMRTHLGDVFGGDNIHFVASVDAMYAYRYHILHTSHKPDMYFDYTITLKFSAN